jgi:hypothetical protein
VSAHSFREVIALLDGHAEQFHDTLDRAVEIAAAEHARLTLAKTTSAGWLAGCTCGFPIATALPLVDLQEHARESLARAAELVPQSLSLTTVLLAADTHGSLCKLLDRGNYDLLVATEPFLHRHRRLRRALDRMGISMLAVCADTRVRAGAPRKRLRTRPATQM